MTLVASAHPEKPFLYTLKKLRGDKWDRAISDFAAGQVPQGHSIVFKGVTQSFSNWVDCTLFNAVGVEQKEELEALKDFIVQEAKFLTSRKSFNAFKHGLRLISGPMDVRIIPEGSPDGAGISLSGEYAVHWLDWESSGPDEYSYRTSTKAIDPGFDIRRIGVAADLMRVWKERRTVEARAGLLEIKVPSIPSGHGPTNQFSFKIGLEFAKGGGEERGS